MSTKLIPQEFIQTILKKTDIVHLIQVRVNLKKKGNYYAGLCPFHNEKTPSFTVHANKQFYHCFGCQANGNAIRFLQDFDQMKFPEAVQYLAEQLGLEVPYQSDRETHHYASQNSYRFLERVKTYYEAQLKSSAEAIKYLKSRGISGNLAKAFGIGYAPISLKHLNQFTRTPSDHEQLVQNGLRIQSKQAQAPRFERFRDRIMFPIRNIHGYVIGFGGRALTPRTQPKYLNSPQSPVFHKGEELYGLYEVKQQHKKPSELLVVEGYLDVIALHQHGLTIAVATLGTSITKKHLQTLIRYTNHIIYCFDGDAAGKQAAWRALLTSFNVMREGLQIRFLFLPNNEDPDSLIRKSGAAYFKSLINKSIPLSQVFMNYLKAKYPKDDHIIENKVTFAKEAVEHLKGMRHGLFYQLLIKEIAQLMAVDLEELITWVQASPANPGSTVAQRSLNNRSATPKNNIIARVVSPAHCALSILLENSSLIEKIKNYQYLEKIPDPVTQLLFRLIRTLKEAPRLQVGGLLELCDHEEDQKLITHIAAHPTLFSTNMCLETELQGAMTRLKEQYQQLLIDELIEKIKKQKLTSEEQKKLHKLLTNPITDFI